MRAPRLAIFALLALLLLLTAWTSAAGAATFCVSDPSCPAGGTLEPTVRAALADAARTAERDRVQIGPGTFTEDGLTANSPVDVVGAGSDRTTLIPNGGTTTTLAMTDASSTVTDLAIVVPAASGGVGLNVIGATATRVTVSGVGLTNATGAALGGGRFSDGRIDLNGTPATTGVSEGIFGGSLVSDSRISAPIGDANVRLQRVHVVASNVGVTLSPSFLTFTSSTTLDDVLVELTAAGAVGAQASATGSFVFGSQSARLTLRHVTIAGQSDGSSIGVQATATGGIDLDGRTPIPANVTATLASTIVTGVARPIDARLANSGSALVQSDFSDWDPRTASAAGGAQILRGAHDVNVAPGFADAGGGDFSLPAGSPLVDRGDAALASGESAADLAGAPRIVDGNGDGSAVSDVGAFEFQPPRPPAPPGGGPAGAPTLSRLRLSHTRFAVAAGATARSAATRRRRARRAPRGTTISFVLDRTATVAFTIQRKRPGLRKGHSCVAPTRRLRRARARACRRFTTTFAFTRAGAAGANDVAFSGRAGRRALPRGSYRLTAVAHADGKDSKAAGPVAFAIVRG